MVVKLFLRLSLVLALVCTAELAEAQCPMCKMSAETNLENGGSAGRGLNKGILYLFATPYLIIGGIGYMWYRNKKQQEAAADATLLPGDVQLN